MSCNCKEPGTGYNAPGRPGGCGTPECRESQEYTYAWDNSGTDFRWPSARYEIDWSDNRTTEFIQTTASNSGWSAQLTEFAASANAGVNGTIRATFEPRYVDSGPSGDPSSIDGTINGPGGTPSGLPGAPSSEIALQLVEQGMSYRYVNVQICPGEPVPIQVRLVAVDDDGGRGNVPSLPYILDSTASAILGPKRRFEACISCGKVKWMIEDPTSPDANDAGYREPLASEIPNCWEPCGTLINAPAPPESECTPDYVVGCDDVGSADSSDWITVTRRTLTCPGQDLAVDYFIEESSAPTLEIYNGGNGLIGAFVDCASGEPIPEPEPECGELEYAGPLWVLEGNPQPGANLDWWAPTSFPGGSNAAPHDNVSNIFTVSADGSTLEHVNGPPDVSYIETNAFTFDTLSGGFVANVGAAGTGETSGTDHIRMSGYIVMTKPGKLADSSPSNRTGERGGIWINECCAGELTPLEEVTTDTSGGGNEGVFNGTQVPAGIHYIEIAVSDLSSWMDLGLSVSYDDGATYEPFIGYSTKPNYKCISLQRCSNSGKLIDSVTGEEVIPGPFDQTCKPEGCGGDCLECG